MSTDIHERRVAAAGFAFVAIGMVILFGSHPHPGSGNFRELMQAEVRDQWRSFAVHGGFIGIEALSLTSFLILSRTFADARFRVTAANVALAVGVAALGLSMIVDGMVTPSLAARYLAAEPGADADAIKGSLVFCAALIETLMPVGLAFHALSIAGWSTSFMRIPGWPGFIGVVGLLTSLGLLLVVVLSRLHLPAHAVFGAIAILILWHVGAAAVAWRSSPR